MDEYKSYLMRPEETRSFVLTWLSQNSHVLKVLESGSPVGYPLHLKIPIVVNGYELYPHEEQALRKNGRLPARCLRNPRTP